MKTLNKAVFVLTVFVLGVLALAPAFTTMAFANSQPGRWAVLVEGTGKYTRHIDSQSELAQQFFDQGLRLMYGYYVLEAIASFTEALQHDSNNPMIYCGLALASGPNPNSRYGRLPDDPKGNARKAINMAIKLIDSASAKDRALIEAVQIRFDVKRYPEQTMRDSAYLDAMRILFERYPDDPDIGTLYADAYMVTEPWSYWTFDGKPKPGTVLAAQALEAVMAQRPDHPGANHIYIHLIEAGPTPERALPAADRLEGLMPIAGHVVHMPSHIYVRTGQYEKAIATNERSLAADKKFNEIWGNKPRPKSGTYFLSATNHGRHAVDFIRYAASVQGNYQRAIEAAWEDRRNQSERAIKRGIGQRDVITPWLVHKMFGQWEALNAEKRSYVGLPYVDGIWFYVHGSAHVANDDLASAEEALAELQKIQSDPASRKTFSRFNAVSTLLEIAVLGLDGEIKQARGDFSGAIESFRKAVHIQDRLSYIEPPDWPQPMRHYLGAALLEAERHAEAEQVYRRDLEWNRGNGWALYGLWLSLKAQGREEQARQVRGEFDAAWKNADVMLSSSRF